MVEGMEGMKGNLLIQRSRILMMEESGSASHDLRLS